MGETALEGAPGQLLDIVDLADGHDRIDSEPAGDDQWLILIVADDSDPRTTGELADLIVEFGTELGVGDVVNPAVDPIVGSADCQTAAFGSQMRVIVGAVKNIGDTVVVSHHAKKTAHEKIPGKRLKLATYNLP